MEYKTLDKSIVRESKVRNVFFKACKKELFYTNLKVNTSAEELLKCSKTLFAYPSLIGGGSGLCVQKLTSYGKSPDNAFHIKAHTDPITCFEFSPFNDRVLATGSRDQTIKLWSLGEEEDDLMSKPFVQDPLMTLPKQNKRITGVYFHPSVDNLFVSSTGEYTVDLWDLTKGTGETTAPLLRATGSTDFVLSMAWNTWSGGNMFATSSRDKKMRLYDPRSSALPVREVVTHEGAQGFKLAWADSQGIDLLCTVGANKGAQRQLFVWDPRELAKPLNVVGITTDSSVLTPYYDYATNILYLGGKGDGIYYYELDRSNAHLIGKATFGNNTQSAVSMLPKLVCDVSLCEVDRFLRLTNNTVEMVSFMVPRKSTTLFQEDIFPPAPSGDPTTDVGLWFRSDNRDAKVTPHTVSLQPAGMKSIYEVSEEEGGKNKQRDKLDHMASLLGSDTRGGASGTGTSDGGFMTEGDVKQEVEGWLFNSFQPRYLKIIKDRVYCFLNEDAAQSLWEVSMTNIKYVDIYDAPEGEQGASPPSSTSEWSLRFNIIQNNGKEYCLECSSIELRDAWIASINAHREMKKAVDLPKESSPTLSDFHLVNNSPASSPATITGNNNNNSVFVVPNLPASATIKKTHSVLSRNPSYTSLKLSGGMTPPTSSSSSSSTPTSSTPPLPNGNALPPFGAPISSIPSNQPTNNNNNNNNQKSTLITIKLDDIIIEGSLFELVPGLIWNSNIEKWYIVADGILYSYRTKQLARTGDPLESIHLEKALSVHKTKDIFKIEGFSFQLTTPNRIIHLLAKNKEEVKSWISVLRQNLKSSGESKPINGGNGSNQSSRSTSLNNSTGFSTPPLNNNSNNNSNNDENSILIDDGENNLGGLEEEVDEEEEEEDLMLEGTIGRKLNGIFSMWSNVYMTLLAEDLFLSKNKQATTPELRIQMSSVASIKKLSPTEFTLYDAANVVLCNFRTIAPPTEEFDDCQRWIDGLEAARKRSIDIVKMFGISDKDEVLGAANSSTGNLEGLANVDETKYLDLTAVKNGKVKMLMQVKGKRKIRVVMTKLAPESLNTHNSFVLDAGPRIFVWTGTKSSRVNRAKALDFANRIRQKERGGKSTLIQLDEGRDDSDDFWFILGGGGGRTDKVLANRNSVTPEEQDGEKTRMAIYRIGIDVKKNSLRARLAWEGSDWRLPNKELLHTKFVYVVDCVTEVYVWVGKESAAAQRRMGGKVAAALLSRDRPDWVRITRLTEFGENNLFKEKFANYPGMLPISTSKTEVKSNIAITKAEHKLEDLVARMQCSVEDSSFNRAPATAFIEGGRTRIWKIDDYEKIDHPESLFGQFFTGDSYIVLYTYTLNNKEAHIIYYYLGRDSSINDKGTSAYLTVDLHDQLGGNCVQVRVVQNKEVRNFLRLFKNKMLIHASKSTTHDADKNAVYEVRGRDAIDARAVQVDTSSSVLNTQHSFIITNPSSSTVYVWHGTHSSAIEQQAALSIAQHAFTTFTIEQVQEGEEPDQLWTSINGRCKYFNDIMLKLQNNDNNNELTSQPRLFICSNSSGINEVTEESPYSQDDLETGNVIILDAQTCIYIWLGGRAPHRTKRTAMEVAIAFCKQSKFGHTEKTPILIVEPFHEPLAFRSYFRAWITNKYPKHKLPLQEKIAVPVDQILKDYLKEVYSYEELLADPMPAGIDTTKLEYYLSNEEFTKIFNCTRQDWEKIPSWRRENIKRSLFLF